MSCGFRCFTNREIRAQLKIEQPTMPFDNGFFSVDSIIKFMEADSLDINLKNTAPCIKKENFRHNNRLGIRFETSSYTQIDDYIEKNGHDSRYLDGTHGYYTLCEDYGFVLAHYNWHKMAHKKKSKGVTDPEKNIDNINHMLSKRKDRLLDTIGGSEKINLCFLNHQKYEFMRINQISYTIREDSMNTLKCYFEDRFKNKMFEIMILQK